MWCLLLIFMSIWYPARSHCTHTHTNEKKTNFQTDLRHIAHKPSVLEKLSDF